MTTLLSRCRVLLVPALVVLAACSGGSQSRTTASSHAALLPDPCATNNGGCDANSVCLNSESGTARCSCTGCGPLAVATTQPNPYAVTSVGNTVYWTDPDVGAILAAPAAGGTTQTIVSGLYAPLAIAADSNSLYWTAGDGSISKAALTGGAITTLVTPRRGEMNYQLTLRAGHLYWTSLDLGTVSSVPVAGGAVTTLASGRDGPLGLAVDATNAYWADSDTGVIASAPLAGGSVTTIATGQSAAIGVAVSATDVYWTVYDAGAIVTAPIAGGDPSTLTADSPHAFGLTIDGGNLYWTNLDASGSIMTLSLAGGTPATMAANQSRPLWISVDDNGIYWTNRGGSVMTLGLTCGSGVCQCARGTSSSADVCVDACTVSNGGCPSTSACTHVGADNSILCEDCGTHTPCNGACVDTAFDPANCGSCGNACADTESCEAGACVTTANACDRVVNLDNAAVWSSEGFVYQGHTSGPTTAEGSCGGDSAPEVALTFTVPTDGIVELTTDSPDTTFDTVLYVRSTCGDDTTQLACTDDTASSTLAALEIPDVTAGTILTVFVDGYRTGGAFTLKGHFGACHSGETSCSGTCTNLQTDEAHCGDCGIACGSGDICQSGTCGACTGGQTACDGACVDTQSDSANCGACGRTCSLGQTCSGGSCVASCNHAIDLTTEATWTATGFTFSGRTGASGSSTSGSCGGSGPENVLTFVAPLAGSVTLSTTGNFDTVLYARRTCDVASTEFDCSEDSGGESLITLTNVAQGTPISVFVDGYGGASGRYTLTGTFAGCDTGFTDCDGVCANLQTSAANCNACGTACTAGQVCVAGACTACGTGLTACGDRCVDLLTDSNNCNTCGTVCPAEQVCVAGACASSPDVCTRLVDLDTAAVWTSEGFTYEGDNRGTSTTSSDGCGGLGPENGYTVTAPTAGVLTLSTDYPETTFDAILYTRDACDGSELTCDYGLLTVENLNAGDTVTFFVDAFSGDSGHFKLTGSFSACAPGLDACTSGCTDVTNDRDNCGACNNACTATQTCDTGECTDCVGGSVCGNACVNLQTDVANCGGCDNPCSEGEECTAGTCSVTPDVCSRLVNLNATATWSSTGFTIDGTTHGASTAEGGCASSTGPENGYTLTVPADGDITLSTEGGQTGDFDTVLYVRSTCGDTDTQLACNDDVMIGTRPSQLTLTGVTAGTVLYIIVDGYRAAGSYTLTGTLTLPACGADQMLCGGACVSSKSDNAHCGTCENACSDGQTCVEGHCTGGTTDGGTTQDGGTTTEDGGTTTEDGGTTTEDGGTTTQDGGATTDGGFTIGNKDAGTSTPKKIPTSGCGCSSPAGSLPGFLLIAQAFGMMVLRRNRRRANLVGR